MFEMDIPINTAPLAVTQSLTLELIDSTGAAYPMQAELCFDAGDPYAVSTAFRAGHTEVCWTFGRDLLIEGLHEPTGDGDVHVWPCLDADGRAVVIIELCSPDGEAMVQARTNDVARFVQRMTRAVPVGSESEHINFDAAIAALLDAPAA